MKAFYILSACLIGLMGCSKTDNDTDKDDNTGQNDGTFFYYDVKDGTQNVPGGCSLMDNGMVYWFGNYVSAIGNDSVLQFAHLYTASGNRHITYDGVVTDGQGGIYAAARVDYYAVLAKFDGSGNVVWSKEFGKINNPVYNGGAYEHNTPNISNIHNGRFVHSSGAIVSLVTTDGQLLWQRKVSSGGASQAILFDSGILVLGKREGTNVLTIKKLDWQGNLLWSKEAGEGANSDFAFGEPFSVNSTQALLSYVRLENPSGAKTRGIWKIDGEGNILFNKTYQGLNDVPAHASHYIRPIAVTRAGNGKIWAHVPGYIYTVQGQYEPWEYGMYINAEANPETPLAGKIFYTKGLAYNSFVSDQSRVLAFVEGRLLAGSLNAPCAVQRSNREMKVTVATPTPNIKTMHIYSGTLDDYNGTLQPLDFIKAGTNAQVKNLGACEWR